MTTSMTDSIVASNQAIGSPGTFEIGMDIIIFDEGIHKVFFNLCVSSMSNDVEYDTLMKSLNKFFKPIKSYFGARYKFFSSEPTSVIRDIFVEGMGSGPIRDRLLKEDASKVGVAYSNLLEIATTKEAATNEKSGWKREWADLKYQKKNNIHGQAKQSFNVSKEQKSNAGFAAVPIIFNNIADTTIGNATIAVKNKTQNTFLSNKDYDDKTVNYDLLNTCFSIADPSYQNGAVILFTVNLIVENNNVNFEIDTGSQHSVISKRYHQLFSYIEFKNRWKNICRFGVPKQKIYKLKSYNLRKTQISMAEGCLLCCYRVIITIKFRNNIMSELHSYHIWCIAIFLDHFKTNIFFIIADATIKWFELFQVNSVTAEIVIQQFSEIIARFGIPKAITSDGTKCFTGIRHMPGTLFHPKANGCVESAVKTIKNFFKKCLTAQSQLNEFLLMYTQLMLGRSTRLQFDALMLNTNEAVIDNDKYHKRHNDQLIIDKSSIPLSNFISLTSVGQTNENSKNTETLFENQNSDPVIVNETSRPIRSRKPPQQNSPSDCNYYFILNHIFYSKYSNVKTILTKELWHIQNLHCILKVLSILIIIKYHIVIGEDCPLVISE
ncbi:hypothetical protein QTP88_007261 [Uroleucon formosanum]